MANGQHGYAFRAAPLDLPALQALLAALFADQPVFAFAADVTTLLLLRRHASAQAAPLDADFGHIFNRDLELRWRRSPDDGRYDALALSEGDPAQPLAAGMRQIRQYRALAAAQAAAIRLDLPHPSTGGYTLLDYVEYHAASGGVQLLRYSGAR